MTPSKEQKLKKFILITLFAFTGFLIAHYFVSTRSYHITFDSFQYYHFFYNTLDQGLLLRYEPLFSLLTYILTLIFDSYVGYFSGLFIALCAFHYNFKRLVSECIPRQDKYLLNIYIFFLLLSSWFVVASINGLRQGLSLPLLYSAAWLFSSSKYFKALFYLVIATLFHFSVILFIPFLMLLGLRLHIVFFGFCLVGVGYVLGVNEFLVKEISDFTGLSLYDKITEYGTDPSSEYHGFSWLFFGYTFVYGFIFFFSRKYVYLNVTSVYQRLLIIYLLLAMGFFVWGFSGFSNRYGVVSWGLIPFMQLFLFCFLNVSVKYKLLLSVFLVPLSLILFIRYLI